MWPEPSRSPCGFCECGAGAEAPGPAETDRALQVPFLLRDYWTREGWTKPCRRFLPAAGSLGGALCRPGGGPGPAKADRARQVLFLLRGYGTRKG